MGYGEGISQCCSNALELLMLSRRCRQVGHIGMDRCLLDVTAWRGQVNIGDEVVIISSVATCFNSRHRCIVASCTRTICTASPLLLALLSVPRMRDATALVLREQSSCHGVPPGRLAEEQWSQCTQSTRASSALL
jgi:Alanine racemase, C-terminal domain